MIVRKLAVLGICLAVVGSAAAVELISNLPGNDATQSASLGGGRIKAMGFKMPAGDDYYLEDVTLRLNIPTSIPDPLVRIYDDVGGLPNKELVALVDPTLKPGIDNYAFKAPAQFTLMADATYWVVAWSESGTYDWKGSSPAQTPTGLATHAGSLFSATSGPNPPTSPSSIFTSYSVSGTIVPEPASMLLALAGVALLRRR